jgi:flavin-dependent dehydrogenase
MSRCMQNERVEFDFIVIGGGPAGLTAAIVAARLGKKVAILERSNAFGPEPRGETLHNDPILDEIIGSGVMESLALQKTPLREFYAPNPSQMIVVSRPTDSIVFEWKAWIQKFIDVIKSLPTVSTFLNAEVTDLILESDIVRGVVYRSTKGKNNSEKTPNTNTDSGNKLFGNCILACDGYTSTIGHKFKIPYSSMNFPIIKCLMKNGNFPTPAFKFFFVPHGSLEYAPEFPPIIIFLFPRDGKNLETGIMIQTDSANVLHIPMPKDVEIMRVWVKLKDQYPLYSKMIKGATITYEKLTSLPMTGPIDANLMLPKKGVVLIGDAAGFIEISGGSGLISSIKMASFWVNAIVESMKSISNDTQDRSAILDLWSDSNILKWKKQFAASPIYKHIVKNARLYRYFRHIIFVKWHTSERIMKNWKFLKLLMKIA